METVKVSAKGQVVLPARIRKKYGIHPGSRVQMFEYENLIYIVPPSEDPVRDAMGCLPAKPSLSQQLLKQRKRDFV